MALVSPGISITVTDESQYVSSAVGSVPFVLLATAQDKIFNGAVAPYTTAANAGKLLSVTSQRDLINNFGYPTFLQSSAGTPLNANELNEYGLMTGYSALGVCNLMYIIRADIDLAQLEGTAVRPQGAVANGVYWLNLSSTTWGIYEWNAVTSSFVNRIPLVITDSTETVLVGPVPTPLDSIGTVGSYAVVASSPSNFMFYKRSDNTWQQIGSTGWQDAWPTVTGTVVSNPGSGITPGNVIINGSNVSISGTSLSGAASDITTAAITGVTADVINGNQLVIYADSTALLEEVVLGTDDVATVASLGLTAGTYKVPVLFYGSYVDAPQWSTTDLHPSGSVWLKTSTLGTGANLAFSEYNSSSDSWVSVAAPIYANNAAAIYAMDPSAGGFGIQAGSLYVEQDVLGDNTASLRTYVRSTQGAVSVTGSNTTFTPTSFTALDSFNVTTTVVGSSSTTTTTVTLPSSATRDGAYFVSSVLAANIPNVTASLAASGAIVIRQTVGGDITFHANIGTPLTTAGFTSSTTGLVVPPSDASALLASNFTSLTYTVSTATPYTAPADGTLWFFNSPLDVDIMVNETTGWKGYRTISSDARGYNLVNTDPAGAILSPTQPTTQSDGLTALAAGDLWIDTGDLVNFPVISRYTGTTWELIDNTDVVSQNGIVFADARWGTDGTIDPIEGALPLIADLLLSNYIDLDCPDHRLYPRGTLLFNLRRSGYNVKHYVSDYFNDQSFPNETLPTEHATWITSSGLQNNGAPYMGAGAQRNMVVKALKAAIDGNEMVREDSFQFNLVVCPGYPELIPNMVSLNNDRVDTAFTLGDTPMTLPANSTAITAWSTDSNGDGLAVADPYMAVYYPSGLTNDLQGNTIVVPPSHMILRAAIKSDNISYPWFAFAGTRRGLIDNATDLGYIDANSGEFVRNGINQGLRDAMYPMAVNPITLLPGVGITNFGNKTRSGTTSAMDRVNVARLVNYIRTIFATVGNGFLFEPNDTITRNQLAGIISSSLNDLVTKRGIYDYAVVCDTSNNTPDRIANNELWVDVAIEPMKDVEFIYIPIRLLNPGSISAT